MTFAKRCLKTRIRFSLDVRSAMATGEEFWFQTIEEPDLRNSGCFCRYLHLSLYLSSCMNVSVLISLSVRLQNVFVSYHRFMFI